MARGWLQPWLGRRVGVRKIPLNWGAGDENRTRMTSLEDRSRGLPYELQQ
jgi:hypothetical protein